MKNYRVAVVGATGRVGQTFIKVLEERNFPISKIVFFASKRSAGQEIRFRGTPYRVMELTTTSFNEGFDFVLFSAGGETSLNFAPYAAEQGAIVIDNSSAWRMKSGYPLIVPEVNGKVLTAKDKIIANPNCSTIQSVVPLKVIHDLFCLKRVVYSTYQAVSGSGYKGVFDLERGKNNQEPQFYAKPIYENVLPHIDDFLESGYTKEEKKMMDETRKILGINDLKVTATCVRVPVLNGHSVSINVECEKQIDLPLLKEKMKDMGIHVFENQSYPTPKDVSGSDQIYVGRLRIDDSVLNGLNLWVVADNIRKGAATNAIEIAEYLIKEGIK